jgi:hypothetical protein
MIVAIIDTSRKLNKKCLFKKLDTNNMAEAIPIANNYMLL